MYIKKTITQIDDGLDFGTYTMMSKLKENNIDYNKKIKDVLLDLSERMILLRRISLENNLVKDHLKDLNNEINIEKINNIVNIFNIIS